jgi:hypothetical protein
MDAVAPGIPKGLYLLWLTSDVVGFAIIYRAAGSSTVQFSVTDFN